MYSSRVEYYKQLKDEFQGAVIAYITGDRPGFETRIAQDVIDLLFVNLFRRQDIMSVLTNRTGTKITGQLLTNKRDVPFILGFRYPLEKKFTLTELEKRNNKELQGFLDKVSQMSVQQVDESFARKPDKDDTYRGLQVYHYEVTKSFRIHVVSEDGIYKIIRLDPNHRVHE